MFLKRGKVHIVDVEIINILITFALMPIIIGYAIKEIDQAVYDKLGREIFYLYLILKLNYQKLIK